MTMFSDRELIVASTGPDFSETVNGVVFGNYEGVETHKQAQVRTGKEYVTPDELIRYPIYTIAYFKDGALVPSLLMTPYIKRRTMPDSLPVPEGFAKVGQHQLGDTMVISETEDFAQSVQGELTYQDVSENKQNNIFGVSHYSESMGCMTVTYGYYAKPPAVNLPEEGENTVSTTKSQLYGLLTQLENLMDNSDSTPAAMRSVADLFAKSDEVKAELETLRQIVKESDYAN